MPKVVKDPYIQASYKKEMGKPWYDLYTDEELDYAQKLLGDPSLPSTIPSSLNPNKWTHLASNDWFDVIFDKVGMSHQHNLNISGATDKVSYYLGTEYYAENGMLHYNKDHYSRFNVRSKTEYRPFEWLTVGNNTALTYYKYDRPTNFGSWSIELQMRRIHWYRSIIRTALIPKKELLWSEHWLTEEKARRKVQ